MPTLVSYPGLYGLADNNPYGLKVYAFLKLCGVAFRHEHVSTRRARRAASCPTSWTAKRPSATATRSSRT
jgi:hypothetical protein